MVCRFFVDKLRCAPDIARLLTRISCFKGFLLTGSPLSPLLSFLAYWPMFEELSNVATDRGLSYTVYVDDVVMSGQGAVLPP